MLAIQKSLRRTLVKISRLASHLGSLGEDEEFKETLVDIYVAVVDFWVEAIKDVRRYPLGFGFTRDPDQPWKDIRLTLTKTLVDIEQRYNTIQQLADQAFVIPAETTLSRLTLRRSSTTPEPTKSRVFVIPLPENTQFLGRDQLLERMHEHLRPQSRGSRLHCFTLYGLGGVGKSQTAAAYAYKYAGRKGHTSDYDTVFWIDSESEDAMRQSFREVAQALKGPAITAATDPQQIRREVQNWLTETGAYGITNDSAHGSAVYEVFETDREWLIIYDNANSWNTIMGYWPQGPSTGAIIITSRDFSLANRPASAGEELSTLGTKESSNLFMCLLDSYDENDEEEAKAFSELLVYLDGLPLAIQQIASFINSRRYTVSEFFQHYKRHRCQIHQERGYNSYAFYTHSLQSVWRFAFQNIALEQETMVLLGIISFLSPDGIPKNLFSAPHLAGSLDYLAFCKDEFMLRTLLTKLRSTAMIRESQKSITIHRLTQAAFLDFIDSERTTQIFAAASMLVHEAFPKQHLGDPLFSQWATCSVYAAHARSLALHWDAANEGYRKLQAPLQLVELLCNSAWYLREIGDFDGSLLLIEIGCRAAERQSEVQTAFKLLQAHLLNTKGVVLWLLFDYSQSKLALEQALAIRSQLLDEDDVELIGTKANLASLTAAEGRYKEAQILYRQAEEDNDRSKEATHAKRLASCRYAATHGRLHTELGQLEEAERHLERSRTILASGEDNALYRRAIEYCFGNLRLAENKLLEAKQCYKVCLETFAQAITDKDQVRTCGCYYKLAVIEMLEGQPQAARYEESLDASRCVLMLMMLNRMNLREASNIALQINSMGWQGRITLLDANILRKFPEFERTQRETAEQLERRADAIKAALQAISGEEETAEKGFHLYIPWQTR